MGRNDIVIVFVCIVTKIFNQTFEIETISIPLKNCPGLDLNISNVAFLIFTESALILVNLLYSDSCHLKHSRAAKNCWKLQEFKMPNLKNICALSVLLLKIFLTVNCGSNSSVL